VDLEPIAARLGADVAFFLHGKPAFASGIGENIEPLDDWSGSAPSGSAPSGSVQKWKALVVVPDVHVSTAEAYANVTPNDRDRPDLRDAVRQPIETWKDTIVNDFEASVTAAHPVIGRLRDLLYETGAQYAAMSGSGSAVFGLFAAHPEVAWARIRKEYPSSRTWMGAL
jgi:4-diphosphocytidyl-2-C-methyl-D-erythritol kinase